MFKKTIENKAKLEHKLYLAREDPESIFDISDCGIKCVPQGIYSLCKVFRKEILKLDHNNLTSLSGGGKLKDLSLLKVLDLQFNSFNQLPDDINLLENLEEFYINNNAIKVLPEKICYLNNLKLLDVANNLLKSLPDDIGNLINLKTLIINNNTKLKILPKSICKMQNLTTLKLDSINFIYPPEDVIEKDVGYTFVPSEKQQINDNKLINENLVDNFQAKIWKIEQAKLLKSQEFLKLEKENELIQQKEFQLANLQKIKKEKLLADIIQEQNNFDKKLTKLHEKKESERFHLIEQLQMIERKAENEINQLLKINFKSITQFILEQEKNDEEFLLKNENKSNDQLKRNDILINMQEILNQETRKFQKLIKGRTEITKNILKHELQFDNTISKILENQDLQKNELLLRIQQDNELQKTAVCTLLERGDARYWSLIQQVRLVTQQLTALTNIENDRRKLQMDNCLMDLVNKRVQLSNLLINLLDEQKQRRLQLITKLQTIEENCLYKEDFWLRQYQKLLNNLPDGLSDAQKNMDSELIQILLINGVIHFLPFLAKLIQCQCNLNNVNETQLMTAGIYNSNDRIKILEAFKFYEKQKSTIIVEPSAPQNEASAPPLQQITDNIRLSECIICMDNECEIIFTPCGHAGCCLDCSTTINKCPLCRCLIERKIRIVIP